MPSEDTHVPAVAAPLTPEAASAAMTSAPLPPLVVWDGEWTYVKRGITDVREQLCRAYHRISHAFDVPGRVATAKQLGKEADTFVLTQTQKANAQLQKQHWILPATGIAVTSVYVAVRSAPLGAYKVWRNGCGAAIVLTLFLFPREVVNTIDSLLPFSTAEPKATKK